MKEPQVQYSALPAADGSVSYAHGGYTILASVNGPLEVQRRDEIADEVYLEVDLREASGIGGPRERQVESALQAALRPLLLVTAYPRALLQLTLQVIRTPDHAVSAAAQPQHSSALMLQPHLINAAVCALLNANIAMSQVAVAVGLRVPSGASDGERLPEALEIGASLSFHVFAFSSRGELLIAESEGIFSHDTWQQLANVARQRCCGSELDSARSGSLLDWLRTSVANEIQATRRWQSSPAV